MCFDATSQHASLAQRCWWEMRDFVGCTFRFCRCVGPFMVFGTVGSIALSTSSTVQQSVFFSQVSTFNRFSLSSTGRNICVFVPHTGARNSRNRVRTSSSGEELSRYSADDPRGARAVQKLGVIGLELDDGSTSNSHHWCNKSCISVANSFSRRVSFDVHCDPLWTFWPQSVLLHTGNIVRPTSPC